MALKAAFKSGQIFVRFAGVSGASAVGLGAYGSHVLKTKEGLEHEITTFDSANKYHFFHTLALLAVPLCRKPALVGSLMTTGMVLFCVPCYYYAMTSDPTFVKVAPVGGTTLMVAWLAFLL